MGFQQTCEMTKKKYNFLAFVNRIPEEPLEEIKTVYVYWRP